jgi:hypothetical protein
MPDATALADWQHRYDEWKEDAVPQIMKGAAKEAFASYPWFTAEGDPFSVLGKAASEARFALITTGGYSIEGEQEPFVPIPSFDDKAPGIREIPLDVDRSKLVIHHPGYDHRFAEEDINVNLPLDRLREMSEAGDEPHIVDRGNHSVTEPPSFGATRSLPPFPKSRAAPARISRR